MTPHPGNIFADLPPRSAPEHFLTLTQSGKVRIERIVSNGQCSPKDFWYDQPEDEWVLLVQGGATLGFEDSAPVRLKAGDYLMIARHIKHRIDETSADAVWLAVHYV